MLGGCSSTTVETTSSQTPTQVVNNITVVEAYDLIQANAGNPDFIIIDVRTPEEYAAGHIENAVLINYNSGNFKEEIGKYDRGKKYLIYCRSGNRSAGARGVMIELSFRDINHMNGGITEWLAEGLPVVK
ncbi:MAG: hypothetical protein A2Y90_06245 [Chloroflexi bacterium RBG_13_52_12]|nr:MAG: hypothetical protein A2Y90_06245 [Chloroflexi bacterium RBG_13_52_12]